MPDDLLYLRPDVQIEPLVDQWYAWSHLISPATTARNITERHFKIMDSYISAPQLHAMAVRDPKMLGGPFIDYSGGRVEEIVALRARTKQKRAHLLELSAALSALDATLRKNATGSCLEPLYRSIPDPLRGYVELVYDLDNHPSYRLIEPLLYRSKYYDRSAQSLMLSLTKGDERPFVLSTPRLDTNGGVHWQIPFDHPALDKVFETESSPRPWSEIRDALSQCAKQDESLLRSFYTPKTPEPYRPYSGRGVRWRYFGHACILVEAGGVSWLFDPVISYAYDTNLPRYTYRDLPDRIDYVLITHNHQDHILFETLLHIRHKVKVVVVPRNGGGTLQDPSIRLALENIGFNNVVDLDEFQTFQTPSGSITGLPFLGEHADLNVRSKLAYLVRIGGHSLLFAADSCNIEPKLYEHLHSEIGPVDILFVGMECDGAPLTWLYGPLFTKKIDRSMDESRRLAGCNYEQAMDIVNQFRCRETYVYAMGQEPWLNHVMSIKYTENSRPITESNRLIEACRDRGIWAERLFGEKEILLAA
jgi:L-ascorbate metabolism protein UlaG (beta-lactamase superfamily)